LKSKFGGVEASDFRRLKELEEESFCFKFIFTEFSMNHAILKDVILKKAASLK
jgi:putative transposase